MGNSVSLEEEVFNMRFASKQLARESKRAMKEHKKQLKKVKKAMEEGNHDVARVYAANAIGFRNQALNYLKLSARLDAVAARIKAAKNVKMLEEMMPKVVKSMSVAVKSVKTEDIAKVMDQFEKGVMELEVRSEVTSGALAVGAKESLYEDHVQELMSQIAEENGMEVAEMMDEASVPVKRKEKEFALEDEDEKQRARLEKLMGI